MVFSWTAFLLILLLFLIRSFFQKEIPDRSNQKQNNAPTIFTQEIFNKLKSPGKHILLTLTSEGCDACDLIRHHPSLEQLPINACFIEREFCHNNMFVSQVLPAYGFPYSFVFDENQNIIGYFRGAAEVEENIQSILLKKDEILTDTLQMLTNSFKSFLAYLDHDLQGMYFYAQESMNHLSYFFNNYLLYVYHRNMQQTDSAELYKTKALQSLQGGDIFVYETLVRELAPEHPMLAWIQESTHVHDPNCRH